MKLTLLGLIGAILGTFLGGILGYELFGFVLARRLFPNLAWAGFDGRSFAFIDILPGERPVMVRMEWTMIVTTLFCASIGLGLGMWLAAGQTRCPEE